MTLEQLKEMLATYGANPEERSMAIFVEVDGKRLPVVSGEIDNGVWDEASHTWQDLDQHAVILQAGEVLP